MDNIYFIKLTDLKNLIRLNYSIDDADILYALMSVQETEIYSLLGDDNYNLLLENIKNNTLTDEQKKLLIYMRKYIATCVEWYLYNELYTTIYKNSIVKKKYEDSEPISVDELKHKISLLYGKMDNQKLKVYNYIKKNCDKLGFNNCFSLSTLCGISIKKL